MPKKSILRVPYDFVRCLPRMSWASDNLFNLYRRSYGPESREVKFTRSNRTLYQQRWMAKRMARGYHGDWIQEKRLKHHFLPAYLPYPRIGRTVKSDRQLATGRFTASRPAPPERKTPLTSLMWTDVERRLDVLVFRACFAPSVYAARFLIIHGRVKVNGVRESNPGTQLDPGALFSVDPVAIPMLHSPKSVADAMHPRHGRRTPDALEAYRARQAAKAPKPKPAVETTDDAEVATVEDGAVAAAEDGADEAPAGDAPAPPKAPKFVAPKSEEMAAYARNDDQPNQARLNHLHGDLAALRTAAAKQPLTFVLPDYAAPHIFVPAYLEVSYATCSAVFVRLPSARPGVSEIPSPYDAAGEVMQFTLEWYAQMNRRLWKTPRRPGAYRTEFDRTALHGHGGALVAEHLASKDDSGLSLAERAERLRERQREVLAQAREHALRKLPPHLLAAPHKSTPPPSSSSNVAALRS